MSNQNTRRKKQKQTPESQFRCTLDQCSKSKDLSAAITLYESSSNPTITLNNLNSLLYICSEALSNSNTRQSAIDFGFKLFRNHSNENLKPNEATLTAVARLAAANGDGDYAFDLAKSVMKQCAAPKLRTFTPALNCFCGAGAADKAYEVEEHVVSAGPQMERALPAMNTIEREHQPNFKEFKEWLEQHSEYETLVDGANIGLYQQNFAHGGFSITQLDAVVKEVHRKTQQQPLVVLHRKRVLLLLENADEQADDGGANVCATRGRELMSPPHSRCEELMGMGWGRVDVENLLPKDDVKGTGAGKS
ncbi:hypothetical protein SASPL_120070 [Salvia splendens]|uniref:PROP1-like PPR domain-containing protein n=1 Tax=Salvia splendens TaxID=180675 RepID=A0A8X8XTV0_SALSN|nr:hypothetical protein SASPL_120070 [Salvia splendens]